MPGTVARRGQLADQPCGRRVVILSLWIGPAVLAGRLAYR